MGAFGVIVAGFAALALLQAILFAWRRSTVARRSVQEWRARAARGDKRLEGLTRDEFVRVYRRVYGPRGQVYVLAGLAAAVASTPIVLAALAGVWRWAWIASDRPVAYAPGDLVWQFYLFFGLIGVWAYIASRFAARHHRRRPGPLDHELARARAGLS